MSKATAPPSTGFAGFVYDGEKGEVFGRTASSWGKIGLFYVIYYCGLTGFFIALLAVFQHTFTDEKAPVLTGKYSILPPTPGMGYQPMIKAEETMLTYNLKDNTTYLKYIDAMDEFLLTGIKPDRVKTPLRLVNYLAPDAENYLADAECGSGNQPVTRDTKPCMFNVSKFDGLLDNCPVGDYGYEVGKPCAVVKLNRVYEFLPVTTDEGSEIHIVCQGEHIADKDNVGKISYWPKAAGKDGKDVGTINTNYFPFLGQPYYMTPLVFIKFENVTKNVLVQVVCRPTNLKFIEEADAKGKNDEGKIHFEVYIQM